MVDEDILHRQRLCTDNVAKPRKIISCLGEPICEIDYPTTVSFVNYTVPQIHLQVRNSTALESDSNLCFHTATRLEYF